MDTPFTPDWLHITTDAAGAWLLIGLAFALGAAMGSFFNVVAYRRPRGMSLSRPGSRCPTCGRPIRWYDNVPIFGWLMLRGRCRDCRAPISARYPIVELMVAVAAALVTWSALEPIVHPELGDVVTIDLAQTALRLALVLTLCCAAIVEFDGHQVPQPLVLVVLIVAAAASGRGLWGIGGGLAAAVVMGLLAWPALVRATGGRQVLGGFAGVIELVLVGVVLGWQAVAAIAVLAMAGMVATRVLARFWPAAARFDWAGWLALGTLIWMVAGQHWAARWQTGDDRSTLLVVAGAIVALLAIAARAARRGHVRA
jgi:leader peptidase (prepilin peptidase) / N-methyltransferase